MPQGHVCLNDDFTPCPGCPDLSLLLGMRPPGLCLKQTKKLCAGFSGATTSQTQQSLSALAWPTVWLLTTAASLAFVQSEAGVAESHTLMRATETTTMRRMTRPTTRHGHRCRSPSCRRRCSRPSGRSPRRWRRCCHPSRRSPLCFAVRSAVLGPSRVHAAIVIAVLRHASLRQCCRRCSRPSRCGPRRSCCCAARVAGGRSSVSS